MMVVSSKSHVSSHHPVARSETPSASSSLSLPKHTQLPIQCTSQISDERDKGI